MLTGERPDVNPGCAARLAELGFEDFTAYVVWCCERALERGLLPHTNLGALSREELARLREVTASQGLMLESVRDDLVAHQGSPTKDPALRLETIRCGGRAEDPVHERDPGRDRRDARRTASTRCEALAAVHAEHGHLQEVILQNFVPHRRYYGEEPAEIADEAARALLARPGSASSRSRGLPAWARAAGLDRGHAAS